MSKPYDSNTPVINGMQPTSNGTIDLSQTTTASPTNIGTDSSGAGNDALYSQVTDIRDGLNSDHTITLDEFKRYQDIVQGAQYEIDKIKEETGHDPTREDIEDITARTTDALRAATNPDGTDQGWVVNINFMEPTDAEAGYQINAVHEVSGRKFNTTAGAYVRQNGAYVETSATTDLGNIGPMRNAEGTLTARVDDGSRASISGTIEGTIQDIGQISRIETELTGTVNNDGETTLSGTATGTYNADGNPIDVTVTGNISDADSYNFTAEATGSLGEERLDGINEVFNGHVGLSNPTLTGTIMGAPNATSFSAQLDVNINSPHVSGVANRLGLVTPEITGSFNAAMVGGDPSATLDLEASAPIWQSPTVDGVAINGTANASLGTEGIDGGVNVELEVSPTAFKGLGM